jgi:hypothetical protein
MVSSTEEVAAGVAAKDPDVRAAVFATVTLKEAYRVIRSRLGKPWCDAFLLSFSEGLDEMVNDPQVESIADSARRVIGVTTKSYRAS